MILNLTLFFKDLDFVNYITNLVSFYPEQLEAKD